jgi:hypothetical protein
MDIVREFFTRLHQSDIPPGVIKQRHIEANIIFFGLAANKPSGSTEVKAYYATDTNVLYLWDGAAWHAH